MRLARADRRPVERADARAQRGGEPYVDDRLVRQPEGGDPRLEFGGGWALTIERQLRADGKQLGDRGVGDRRDGQRAGERLVLVGQRDDIDTAALVAGTLTPAPTSSGSRPAAANTAATVDGTGSDLAATDDRYALQFVGVHQAARLRSGPGGYKCSIIASRASSQSSLVPEWSTLSVSSS
jgi:hypothetical protein